MTDVAERPPGLGATSVRRRLPLGVTALVVALALVGAAVVFVHWRNSPHLLSPYGDTFSEVVPVGVAELSDAGIGPSNDTAKPIDIESMVPRTVVNTADATVSVVLCARPPVDRLGNGTRAEFAASCGVPLVPFHSGRYQLLDEPGHVQLMLAVTMHRAGRVQVDGCQVRYKDGLRRGSDHAGNEFRLTAR